MKKTNKIVKISLLFLVIIFAFVLFNNHYNSNKDNVVEYESIKIEDINNDHYDIYINVDDSTAIIDGKQYKINELEDIPKDEVVDYIKEKSLGEVKLDGEEIVINNPYSLESIIVETNDESIFDEYENIEKVVEISDNLYKVEYRNAQDTKDGFEELKNDDKIENITTDIKVVAFGDVEASSVAIYPWGVSSMGLDFYTSKLESENNNNIVKVAVLDTGIRATHEVFTNDTLKDRIDYNGAYDYVNDDDDPTDDNNHVFYEDGNGHIHELIEYGHGTMVSGAIATSTPKNVKIVPVKVLDDTGSGSFSDILRAINDVKDKVDIINLSLGSPESDSVFDNALRNIYRNSDLIIVAAAGNDAGAVSYPARSSYTLAISSVNVNNNFSSSFSNYGSTVDFAAPGEDLTLPCLKGDVEYATGKSGTSFSAPFASAAIALIKADNPTFKRDDIVNYLKQNAVDLGASGKDVYYGYGSISIHSFINDISVSNTWSTTNKLTATAKSLSNTNYYAITTTEVQPTSWKALPNSTNITINEDIAENGVHYLWIKNNSKTGKYVNGTIRLYNSEGITHTSFNVDHVDNIKPVANSLNIGDKTKNSITVNITTRDEQSGLSKVIWYYKKASESNYSQVIDNFEGVTNNTQLTKQIEGLESYTNYTIYAEIYDSVNNKTTTNKINTTTLLDGDMPYVMYQTHVQNVGWQDYVSNGQMSGTEGQSLRLEGIKIKLENINYSGDIEYRTHIQNIGWESGFKKNNEFSGTEGQSLRLEAIEIKLTGEKADRYDIYYRVHAQNFGWLGWARNGERSGTAGYSYRLEGIEIKLVPKGEKYSEYGKDVIFYDNNSGSILPISDDALVAYTTHVQNVGWQNYVTDGRMAGTEGQSLRLEGIKIKLLNQPYAGNIEYRTHIQNIGWESEFKKNDGFSGTEGQSLRLEAIEIKLTGEMAEHYDVYYRVHAQNFGWLGWAKNGEQAGTAGYAYRLEGIEILVLPKGETPTGYGLGQFRFYQK